MGAKTSNIQNTSFENAIQFVQKLSNMGIKQINFTTKEPLMYSKIFELIRFCTRKGIATSIITNGTLLSKDNSEKLIKSGVNSIYISLEGISQHSNDLIRGKGTLDKVLNALYHLNTIRNKERYVHIGIQMSLNSMNINETQKIPEFVNCLGIDSLHIGDISIDGNAENNSFLKIDRKEYLIGIESIIKHYQLLKNKNFILIFKSLLPYETNYINAKYNTDFSNDAPRCSILDNVFSALPDTKIAPCIALLGKSLMYCNESYDLNNLINEDNVSNIKNEILELIGRYKKDNCIECYYKDECLLCPKLCLEKDFFNSIVNRCNEAKKKFNCLFEKYVTSDDYKIRIKDGVTLYINNVHYELNKMYLSGTVQRKKYKLNYSDIKIIEEIFKHNKKGIGLSELLQNTNSCKDYIVKYLYELFINNFIYFYKDVST